MIITRRTLIGTAATATVPLLSIIPVGAVASDQFLIMCFSYDSGYFPQRLV